MKNDVNAHNASGMSGPFAFPPGIFYKFRAECESDAYLVRLAFANWIVGWYERIDFPHPDIEVEMELIDSAPNLEGLLWFIQQFVDCHVIADTLELREDYTGNRKYKPRQSSPPSDEVVRWVQRPLQQAPEVYRGRRERAKEAEIALRKIL